MANISVPARGKNQAQEKSLDRAIANVSATMRLSMASKALPWGQENSMLIRSTIGTPNRRRKT